MEVTLWPVDKIIPYARNARKISEKAVDKVAASIKEFGWRQPIVVDKDGVIVAGHTRLLAAHKLCMEQVPVHVARNLTQAQVKAYRLMDNRSNDEAEWDMELLGPELLDLQELDLDLSLTGFDDSEIEAFLAKADASTGLTDEDAVPEIPEHPVTELGDLWILGRHRLLCGDSTVATDVEKIMNGEKANLIATDPPYLVNYTGGRHPQSWSNNEKVKDKHWDDYHDPDAAMAFYEEFLSLGLLYLAQGGVVYQWHAALMQYLVHQAWLKCGLLVHQHIVWVKDRPVLTHSHYMWQHEVAFYGWPKGKQPKRRPPANSRTVWNIDQKGDTKEEHPTQKPVELARRPIEYHTDPGGICYEPFGGSGTTMIASESTGRKCFTIEIAPRYCDVIIKRWQDFTGEEAKLESDGRTFAEHSEQRSHAAA